MDEIDRILRSEALVEPAPEFTRSVMTAVQREASTPPPIAFPWRRIAASAAVMTVASTGLAAAPAFREPAQRAITALGAIEGPLAGLAFVSIALSLAISTATLWVSWRAD
jgi:hypothetical protein